MQLLPLLIPDHTTLLIAPPAWGKTRLLAQLIEQGEQSWLIVLPLRALAQEVLHNLSRIGPCAFANENQAVRVTIATPEMLNDERLHAWCLQNHDGIIVWDEWHLIRHWGDSFRPIMRELWQATLLTNHPILALSATVSAQALSEFQHELNYVTRADSFVIDVGNYQFKTAPHCIKYYPKRWVEELVWDKAETGGVLLFVRYRNEVDQWVNALHAQGIRALGCKGGEAQFFVEKLKTYSPQVVVGTTCLGHGVNLPSPRWVCFTYAEDDPDFWLQMVARGGRRGEKFQVISVRRQETTWVQLAKDYLMGLLPAMIRRLYIP